MIPMNRFQTLNAPLVTVLDQWLLKNHFNNGVNDDINISDSSVFLLLL